MHEFFEASCTEADEVIVMTTAQYGRMGPSKCISQFDRVCQTDVLVYLDEACSGLRHCNYPVRQLVVVTPPCRDLLSYLHVSWKCVKGMLRRNLLLNCVMAF